VEIGESQSEAGPGQKCETLSEKQTKAKRAGGVAEVVEHLLRKHEVLSSNQYHQKKTQKKLKQ
jgi:hypothetical protein